MFTMDGIWSNFWKGAIRQDARVGRSHSRVECDNIGQAAMDWQDYVYCAVREIPEGSVATYGQVAAMVAELTLTARQVGSAMRTAPADVPWHRVVGAGGRLLIGRRSPEMKLLQHSLLESEGVRFIGEQGDQVDMKRSRYSMGY